MIYFRADANNIIATGHVMRCLSIADALTQLGEDCCFITADDGNADLFAARGYQYISLDSQFNDMEGELEKLLAVIRSLHIKKLVIDSYYVTGTYLNVLKSECTTLYIDDLNSFIYPVHAVICYANYWEKFEYQSHYPKDCKFITGPEYFPLNKVYSGIPNKVIKEEPKNLLLLSGGSNNFDFFNKYLDSITKGDTSFFDSLGQITVVCGKFDMFYDKLRDNYGNNQKIKILQALPSLKDVIMEADFVVTAGGTTLYELCACGTPCVTYSFADNQLDNCHSFDDEALMKYCGDLRGEGTYQAITEALTKLSSQKFREELSLRMQSKVSENGALNLAKRILEI